MIQTARRILLFILFLNYLFFTVDGINEIFLFPSQCGTVQPADVGFIIRSHQNENYTLQAENCSLVMTATSSSHRLRFDFNTGNGDIGFLENPANNGSSSCAGASIEIFDGPNLSAPSLSNKLCGDLNSNELLSTRDTLTLLLLSIDNATTVNFTAHYTSFTQGASCGADFPCSNGRCISNDMTCDPTRINNCGDFSDNFAGPPGNCSTVTTAAVTTTDQTSTTAESLSSSNDSMIPVYIVLGVIGAALLITLHWLLFKPRWLIWRVCWFGRHGCYKNVSNCLGRNAVDSSPSMDKVSSSVDGVSQKTTTTQPASPEESRDSVRLEYEDGESPFVRGIAKEQHIFAVNK